MIKFSNLHGHTTFSTYDGMGSVEDYCKWHLENSGEGSFAVTDHGNLSSAGYISAAQKKYKDKIKIIWGVEFYFLPSLEKWNQLKTEKAKEKEEKKASAAPEEEAADLVIENEEESKNNKYFDPFLRRNHLVVNAYTQQGLENLFKLVSRSYRQGFYRKPRIDLRMLKELNEGLFASTACLAGTPSYSSFYARNNNLDVMATYENEVGPLMDIFGKDRFFLELQFNKIPEQQIVNKDIIEFSKKTGYSLIAAADCHFANPKLWKDREIYKLLGWQMQSKNIEEKIAEIEEKSVEDLDCHLYLKNGDQMFESYRNEFKKHYDDDELIKQAIEKTHEIATQLVQPVFPNNKIKLPKTFQVNDKIKTAFDQLKNLCIQALKDKKLDVNQEYIDRTIYELKVIKEIGVEEYFLATKEILDTLRKHMLLGPGRGSGCGSLVNYLLGITMIDPIRNGLIFERFMSISRKELPDVDNDVELKDEVFDILKDHFGSENVLAISNYNRLQLKSLVKDISKLYGIPFEEVNNVTKLIEEEAKDAILEDIGHDQKLYELTFEAALKHSSIFNSFIKKYPEVGGYIENLYQQIKSIGKHAGGVCIVPDAEKYLPIINIRKTDQSPVSEGLTVQHLQEYFGIPKFDVLGLATLRIIRRCIELILKNQGNTNPSIEDVWDFYNEKLHPDIIDPNDQKVFEKVYHRGEFPSIFQFAEKGVQRFCTNAKPQSVLDIAAITSLWRPGALGSGGDVKYLGANDAKNKKLFKQEHPVIREILGETRGVLIYQEQFMNLAHKLSGFTLEESNQLRKLLVKPATSLGEELKKKRKEAGEKFIKGAVDNGMLQERAEQLWNDEILSYISYGFNKSHGVAYGYNSYHCAWLYTHYEKEWIKAALECDPDPQEILNNVRKLGYDVKKPDVNLSDVSEWTVTDDKMCIPALVSLKGMGEIGAQELVRNRPSNGFKNLTEFFFDGGQWRYSKFNKKCLEALIKMEAFSSIPDVIGDDKVFKNYKHMHETLFGETAILSKAKKGKYVIHKNLDLIKDGKKTIEELALVADNSDWTVAQKIDSQREIVGFYDKGLIVGNYLKVFNEFDIEAIDQTDDDKDKERVWAIVEEVVQKKTNKTGNPYLNIKVSGMTEKSYTFKVWNEEKLNNLNWKVGNILVFSLSWNDQYGYNVPRKSKVIKVNK